MEGGRVHKKSREGVGPIHLRCVSLSRVMSNGTFCGCLKIIHLIQSFFYKVLRQSYKPTKYGFIFFKKSDAFLR